MITIRYFASLKEALETSLETINSEGIDNVDDIVKQLISRGEQWRQSFVGELPVLIAINHCIVDINYPVRENDEVAFFPPVTGG